MGKMIAYSGTLLLLVFQTLSPAVAAETADPSVERSDALSRYDTRHLDVEGSPINHLMHPKESELYGA